jgi:putative glutamine amidotransferase
MTTRFTCFFVALFFFALSASAEIRLVVWSPPGHMYSYVLPVREGESFPQAVARYQQGVNMNPDLRENIFRKPLALKNGSLSSFLLEADSPKALLLANKAGDFTAAQEYLKNAALPLRSRGIKPYVLPISADLGLSQEEAAEFRSVISRKFDLLVGMGGDDAHPNLYKEKIVYAKPDLSLTRDISETNLIRDFLKEERGFYLGICRGSQLLGVISGCPLTQDIEKITGVKGHGNGFHPAYIDQEASVHFSAIFPGKSEITVNTLHHQAVQPVANSPLRVVLWDGNGIVEGTELESGFGIGVQSHPELMPAEVKTPFFDHIAEEAKAAYGRRHRLRCAETFSSIGN